VSSAGFSVNFVFSRETGDYQDQGVRQEDQGSPEKMCVVYDTINTSCTVTELLFLSGYNFYLM